MKKTNKAFLLATAGSLLLLNGCAEEVQREPAIRPVKTVVLGQSGEGGRRILPGTVQALQRAQLSFRVSGPLTELPVVQGQRVQKDERLARIDPRDFETAVLNSEARLADLQAQYRAMETARPEDIRALEAGLAAARARLVETSAALRRYERLYENDNASKAEYDQSRAAQQVAEAEVRSAEERLQVGVTGTHGQHAPASVG